MQPPADFLGYDPDSLVTETLVSVITKAVIIDDHGERKVVAVKAGKAKKRLVLEPHDIVKELRLLLSLSHPAIIRVLGHDYDASQSIQRFWMPFMPFTLADLLSVPTFSPLSDPDASTHDEEAVLAFTIVAKSVIHQVLSGVAYLHCPERRIAHRDIKPRNILLDTSCAAVLIDFGIAYSQTPGPRDVWPEPEGKMYFEVGSGPYRAPELLFGARKYDATASDLWSLGTMFAEFFTTLHRRTLGDDDDDRDAVERGDATQAYHFDEPSGEWARSEWERYSLFDGSRGDIGLAWSIFRTRGPPTPENWPTFTELPDANKINFIDSPGVHLSTLLPHLVDAPTPPPFRPGKPARVHFPPAEQEPTALDLLHRLLVYPPDSRLRAAAALTHPWLLDDAPLTRDGKTAGEWLKIFLAPGL
ncbi:kinase-like protein [Russula earlei]|uniref:Kinase-like protein n=1 Tax=Russula earlei TaxID=71964 RepID=A0ACC0UM43_9AGAM|nr:kinase-like protein [Russula earlei]